jgi:integrase/recombinase XerD
MLWIFLDTGMRVSELCRLRLADVDHECKALSVQRAGGNERSLTLSPNGWFQLRSYLEQHRPKEIGVKGRAVEEDHLFLSEGYQPLTSNGITLLFHRLRKRAGISEKPVSPSALRDTCAARFLSAGGTLQALGDQLGLRDLAALKRYERAARPPSQTEPQQQPV